MGMVIYWFWASGELQPWAVVKKSESESPPPDYHEVEMKRNGTNYSIKGGHTNVAAEIHD